MYPDESSASTEAESPVRSPHNRFAQCAGCLTAGNLRFTSSCTALYMSRREAVTHKRLQAGNPTIICLCAARAPPNKIESTACSRTTGSHPVFWARARLCANEHTRLMTLPARPSSRCRAALGPQSLNLSLSSVWPDVQRKEVKFVSATEELPAPQYYTTLTLQIAGHVYTRDFIAIDNLQPGVIIGCDFIRRHKLIPDLHARIATTRHNGSPPITASPAYGFGLLQKVLVRPNSHDWKKTFRPFHMPSVWLTPSDGHRLANNHNYVHAKLLANKNELQRINRRGVRRVVWRSEPGEMGLRGALATRGGYKTAGLRSPALQVLALSLSAFPPLQCSPLSNISFRAPGTIKIRPVDKESQGAGTFFYSRDCRYPVSCAANVPLDLSACHTRTHTYTSRAGGRLASSFPHQSQKRQILCGDCKHETLPARTKALDTGVCVRGTTVTERLERSPPTKAIRVQYPARSPDFLKWESCRTMPLVGGFSRGSPVPPVPLFRCRSIFTSIALIGS
ncbi:hypothetical protein PR048_024908 [Dryococelus australis]|uniref:Uncharacterized protein n=1 Tax=Dryococelus australis TaxID=614101 RepID=A0ABQ9GPU1_9NEOP|nr:hypothetical protein PR048_024908 [Dryococelus australis]